LVDVGAEVLDHTHNNSLITMLCCEGQRRTGILVCITDIRTEVLNQAPQNSERCSFERHFA
jgi:hypothetical protein